MAPKRILALAVGDPKVSQFIDHPTKLHGVRPYISGLIDGLTGLGHQLGTDFVISYQQHWHEHIMKGQAFMETSKPALIYAMSTTVMRAAGKHSKDIPIVFPNCSNHKAERFVTEGRATGFSARRTQTAGDCFDRFFRSVPTLKEVLILHKPDYDISDHALELVTKAAEERGVEPRTLGVTSHPDLLDQLSKLPHRERGTPANIGVHVTPVDLLFAATPEIIEWAQRKKHLAAFFPVTDWVHEPYGGFGGYGVAQYKCGERTAGHVHHILWVNRPASELPEVMEATEADFDWAVSGAAAAALEIPTPVHRGARVI
jgi:ABC-type uncharacterized transport system substrate-binding protein